MPVPRACPDCGTPVARAGVRCKPCGKARKRQTMNAWLERHRPLPQPIPQPDPSLPPIGAMEPVDDGARVRCHVCGRAYVSLVVHISRKHGLDTTRYRERYGLNRSQPLVAPTLSARYSAAFIAADTGTIGRLNLLPVTSGTKGVPFSPQASIQASRGHRGSLEEKTAGEP